MTALLEDPDDTERRIGLGLLGRSGLRTDELLRVILADVVDTPSGAHLQVASAKGGHHREPPLATSIEDTMIAYIDVAGIDDTDPVVDVPNRTIERWVRSATDARRAATADGSWSYVTPYDLRRSWATLLLEAGVEPGMVMAAFDSSRTADTQAIKDAKNTFNVIIAKRHNVDFPDQHEVGKMNIYDVREEHMAELLARSWEIQPKDVPIVVFADRYDDTTIFTVDEPFSKFNPADHGIDGIDIEYVSTP